jgi:SAM-dependent methyltransferase
MVGIEIFSSVVERARQNGTRVCDGAQPSPVFLLGDAESLPFCPGSFDFAICSEVLEHLHRPERALREVCAALKSGGWLIVTVPNGYGLSDLLFHHLRDLVARIVPRLPSSDSVGGHIQTFSLGKIRKLVEEMGFRVVKTVNADFLSWLPLLGRSQWIGRVDCKLAERLPSALVGGYFLLCQKR